MASRSGGGIAFPAGDRALILRNTILAGNRGGARFDRNDDCSGGLFTADARNLFANGTGCQPRCCQFEGLLPPLNDVYVDPNIVFSQVLNFANTNGGATTTLAPRPGSPAIDNGECDQPVDQRNVRRPNPSGGRCDIGSVEVSPVGVLALDPAASVVALQERAALKLT